MISLEEAEKWLREHYALVAVKLAPKHPFEIQWGDSKGHYTVEGETILQAVEAAMKKENGEWLN
jgi:hypothetical protein